MFFNSSFNGYENEIQFATILNNKKVKEIPYNFQIFLYDLFEDLTNEDIVRCIKNSEKQKYDIIIKINNTIRRISIKKGIKNSVHAEPISEFIHFLIENKMPKHLIISFLKYHYGDDTTNGKGIKRYSTLEYKKNHQEEIDEINNFINQESLIRKAITRFITLGRNSKYEIDALLYGVPDEFLWIKKDDIYNILLSKKDIYSTSIHFSSLTYQPMNRCLNNNPKYEKERHISQIKWYNLCDDIIENITNNI